MITSTDILRSTIDDIIAAIVPFDRLEEEHQAFVRQWIASGAELFRTEMPNSPAIHLVSYFVVIDQLANKILLVDHKKAQLWLPPGGHVEVDEHPKETVKREVKEELGVDAQFLIEDPVFLTMTKTTDFSHTDISMWYVLKGNSLDVLDYDEGEFHRIRWFSPEEIPFHQADPHLRRFMDKIGGAMSTPPCR